MLTSTTYSLSAKCIFENKRNLSVSNIRRRRLFVRFGLSCLPLDGANGSQGFLSTVQRFQATKVNVRMETMIVTFSTNRMTLHMISPKIQVSVTSQITVAGMQKSNRSKSALARLAKKWLVTVRKWRGPTQMIHKINRLPFWRMITKALTQK